MSMAHSSLNYYTWVEIWILIGTDPASLHNYPQAPFFGADFPDFSTCQYNLSWNIFANVFNVFLWMGSYQGMKSQCAMLMARILFEIIHWRKIDLWTALKFSLSAHLEGSSTICAQSTQNICTTSYFFSWIFF